MFCFDLIKKEPESGARLGQMTTSHGIVHTPAFMPVGTQGTVKALLPEEIKNAVLKSFWEIHTTFIFVRVMKRSNIWGDFIDS